MFPHMLNILTIFSRCSIKRLKKKKNLITMNSRIFKEKKIQYLNYNYGCVLFSLRNILKLPLNLIPTPNLDSII